MNMKLYTWDELKAEDSRRHSLDGVKAEILKALKLAVVHEGGTDVGDVARYAIQHLGEELHENYPEAFTAETAQAIAAQTKRPGQAGDILDKNWDGIGDWLA